MLGLVLSNIHPSTISTNNTQSIYHFHCDEPVLAWRAIGIAARTAIELGLHRRDSLEQNFPEATLRNQAANLFWCIYVLDRRWSFGTGMPFVLQDSDIDPSLPLVSFSKNLHFDEPKLIFKQFSINANHTWNAL